ncbi:MAG TPA: MFS transporter [Candidatus Rothia avicola]|uniref:MFS transporter n=1 Tax=Candidatus Rothia avicola TaxID=2840478 RepID=A0A9D2CS11_9MICC|nr:MFS transporter [Candidatus Rothia avicola]
MTSHTSSLWRNREYRLWFSGDLFLDLGTSIGNFAFPLITLAVTGSPTTAGTVALFQGMGQVMGTLPGGVLADRHDRRRLRLLSCFLGILAQVIFLALLLTGTATVGTLSALALGDRLRSSLLAEASDAMIKEVVPETDLPRAIAINQGRDAAVGLGGGPAGGALLAVGLAYPPLAQLLGQIISLATTWAMTGSYAPQGAKPSRFSARSALNDFLEGGAWLLQRRLLVVLACAICLLNFSISGTLMTLTLSYTQTGTSPVALGALMATVSASMMVGALCAGYLVQKLPTGRVLITGFLMFTICLGLLPWLPGIGWVAFTLALAALVIPTLNAGLLGFLTLITPNDILGRVQSLIGFGSVGLASLAPALAGWGLGLAGLSATAIFFTITCFCATLVVMSSRDLIALPASDQWSDFARSRDLLDKA